ncbi:hypothetical protein MMC25_007929 [Agyrium rufum]|nr:hypothetical protein [Agyrium rufum]
MSDSSSPTIKIAQILAPATALFASGMILSISYSTSPILRAAASSSSPSSTSSGKPSKDETPFSLAQLRALFSSGSHIFPPLALTSTTLFAYLAYFTPEVSSAIAGHILRSPIVASQSSTTSLGLHSPSNLYMAAAAGVISIVPFTFLVMKSTNMRLMEFKEAEVDGVRGKEGANGEDGEDGDGREEVTTLMRRFEVLNAVRAALIGVGGLVGLLGVTMTGAA